MPPPKYALFEHLSPHERARVSDAAIVEMARTGFYQNEVIHSLNLIGASSQQVHATIADGLRASIQAQQSSAESLACSISDSSDMIRGALDSIGSAVTNEIATSRYQLHADNVETHALLEHIWEGLDPKGYASAKRQQWEAEQARAEARQISAEYAEALTLLPRAAQESNQSKGKLMLKEAEVCLERASALEHLSLDANWHLATIKWMQGDAGATRVYLQLSAGEPYSPHWVRVHRFLASVEHRLDLHDHAFKNATMITDYLSILEDLPSSIQIIQNENDWEKKASMLADLVRRFESRTAIPGILGQVTQLMDRKRLFTALETLQHGQASLSSEILQWRPHYGVLSDAARYAVMLKKERIGLSLLKRHHELLNGDPVAQHLMLCEALACPVLSHV